MHMQGQSKCPRKPSNPMSVASIIYPRSSVFICGCPRKIRMVHLNPASSTLPRNARPSDIHNVDAASKPVGLREPASAYPGSTVPIFSKRRPGFQTSPASQPARIHTPGIASFEPVPHSGLSPGCSAFSAVFAPIFPVHDTPSPMNSPLSRTPAAIRQYMVRFRQFQTSPKTSDSL